MYKFLVVTVVTVSGTFSTSAIGRAANPSTTNSIGMKLVLIPAGEFVMGSPEGEGVPKFNQDEKQVRVKLTKLFYLGKHEVTQGQWQAVMKTRPWQGDSSVSWGDAMSFCRKLTLHERSSGKLDRDWEYTLPTEAQWEYACRAGSTKRYSFGDDESQLKEYARYKENADDVGEQYAHEVGRKNGNLFGLHDMHGNMYEWCRDRYQEKLPGGTDPEVQTRPQASSRVGRGGGWDFDAMLSRSAYRFRFSLEAQYDDLGFRLARVQSIR